MHGAPISELPAYQDAWCTDWQASGTAAELSSHALAKRLRNPIWRHAPSRPWPTALRYALGWWGLAVVRELLRQSSPVPSPTLLEGLHALFTAVPLKAKRIARNNLALVYPEASEAWRRATLERSLREIVRTLLESLALEQHSPAGVCEHMEVSGEQHLSEAMQAGRGAIVLTAHYGPFPWGFARLAAANWPIAVIVRRQKDRIFEAHWKRLRDRFGALSIPHQPATLCVGLALKHLRAGGILYLAGDQKAPGEDFLVPFFGHEVHTHGLPARLSHHTGAPLLTAFARYRTDGHTRPNGMTLAIEPPLKPHTDRRASRDEAIAWLLRGYHARLEAVIDECPHAWWWLHNRFHRWC